MEKVALVPYGGLCNRINAIASTFRFCMNEGKTLDVYWFLHDELNCDFSELFLMPSELQIFPNSFLNIITFTRYHKSLFGFSKIIRKILGYKQYYDISYKRFPEEMLKDEKYYLATCHPIVEDFTISEVFKPVKAIQDIIKIESEKFSNTFGVHIRRGDHQRAIEANPLQDFIAKIDEMLAKGFDSFFLATDSDLCKSKLIERYGNKLIYRESELARDTSTGMQDALVELWLLGSTKILLGTRYSMFSKVASDINNIELIYPS